MKVTKKELRKLIQELVAVDAAPVSRDLGYGEGEGRHTKSHLFKIAKYGQQLHDMLNDDDDLPEWVQTKIAVAASNLGKIKHYLEYKIMRMDQSNTMVKEALEFLLTEEDYDSYRDARLVRGGSRYKDKERYRAIRRQQIKRAEEMAAKGVEDAQAGKPMDPSQTHGAYKTAYEETIKGMEPTA